MNLLTLDAAQLADEEVTIKDINQLATPFMLNAALPSAFLQALANSNCGKIEHIKVGCFINIRSCLLVHLLASIFPVFIEFRSVIYVYMWPTL